MAPSAAAFTDRFTSDPVKPIPPRREDSPAAGLGVFINFNIIPHIF